MVNVEKKIVIDIKAKVALKNAYEYIKIDSFQNAEKVKSEILKSFEELLKHPSKHPPDKYRRDNDESFRAYELFSYRITYHISDDEIRIIRIRHTKMNPMTY